MGEALALYICATLCFAQMPLRLKRRASPLNIQFSLALKSAAQIVCSLQLTIALAIVLLRKYIFFIGKNALLFYWRNF
jgi:hypothetical protein